MVRLESFIRRLLMRLAWELLSCSLKGHHSVDDLLFVARSCLPKRLLPSEALVEMQDSALLVDMRYQEQVLRDGKIPGALRLHTNEVLWRLDPACKYKDPHIGEGEYDKRIILLCNQGYSSSLLAALLGRYYGMKNVTDVIGGFEAWGKAKLPVIKS